MQKCFLFILLFFILPFFSTAKKLDSLKYEQHKEFFLNWDNDILVFKDYYYTQGALISFVNPGLRKNPANRILLRLNNADNYFGLGIIQHIYTPKNVNDSLPNLIDRPYAGTFFIRSFSVSSNPNKKLRLTAQLDLGIMGPLAGAKQAQKYIHQWLNLDYPSGWDFQVKNRPYINYNTTIEKGFISIPDFFDFIGTSRLRIGTIHDDIQIGTNVRIGRTNNYFKGLNLSNKKYTENNDFQFYVFGGINSTAVAYNATLMGGVIPPFNNRRIPFKDINHFVGEMFGGFQLSYKIIGIKVQFKWKTQEFEGGEQHGWGTVSMFFRV